MSHEDETASEGDLRPKSEEELNAAANRRDAVKAFDVISDTEDPLTTIEQLASALKCVAETSDGLEQDAIYGIAKCIDDQVEKVMELRSQAWDLLWGYGPGAHRVRP